MTAPPKSARVLPALLLVAVVVLTTSSSWNNAFAYDDRVAVEDNPTVVSLHAPWSYFSEPFYPGDPSVYRPVASLAFALEWAAGHGTPVIFHVTSTVLIAIATLLLFGLTRLAMPVGPGLAAALFFAVHPVHSEAVAAVVGQAELHMTIGVLAACLVYGSARRSGTIGKPGVTLALAALAAYAVFGKEQGFMLPGFLLVVELFFFVDDSRPLMQRIKTVALPFAAVMVVLATAWVLRGNVVADHGAGPMAWAWKGLPTGRRVLTMLGLVPEWVRLLVWPQHLRVDYNPPAFPVATGWGVAQSLGVVAIAAWLWLIVWGVRVTRAVAAGLLWIAVALFPVSNLLLPTGIMLAERTLLSPSVGIALAVGGLIAWGGRQRFAVPFAKRSVLVAGTAIILLFGWWSARRMPVWRSDETAIAQMLRDEPRSYYGHFSRGLWLEANGQDVEADRAFTIAVGLWDRDCRMLEHIAGVLWKQGRIDEAAPLLQRSLEVDETRRGARRLLHAILEKLDRREEARAVAVRGRQLGDPDFAPRGVPPRKTTVMRPSANLSSAAGGER